MALARNIGGTGGFSRRRADLSSGGLPDPIIDLRDGVRIAETNGLQFRLEGSGQIGRKVFVELNGVIDPRGVGHFQSYA